MSTDTQRTNFLGIPVAGDINKADPRTPQRPLSELEPLIRAVLDDELIVEFGWTQYTPFFNDGDPCIFRVGTPWFRTVADVADEDDEEDTDRLTVDYGSHPTLGSRERSWNRATSEYEVGDYEGEHEASYDRCRALSEALDSDAFDHVLLDAFGDHCSVGVKRDGITVDEYSHD